MTEPLLCITLALPPLSRGSSVEPRKGYTNLDPADKPRDDVVCARHGTVLGGESPLYAVEIGNTSLGKGVHREVESEEADDITRVMTNRQSINSLNRRQI